MTTIRKTTAMAAVACSMLVGGAIGATAFGAGSSNAASQATTTTSSSSSTAAPSGTFTPNENAAHEAGESAAREAQEDAGQFPTVP
jgi:hypothetical protein